MKNTYISALLVILGCASAQGRAVKCPNTPPPPPPVCQHATPPPESHAHPPAPPAPVSQRPVSQRPVSQRPVSQRPAYTPPPQARNTPPVAQPVHHAEHAEHHEDHQHAEREHHEAINSHPAHQTPSGGNGNHGNHSGDVVHTQPYPQSSCDSHVPDSYRRHDSYGQNEDRGQSQSRRHGQGNDKDKCPPLVRPVLAPIIADNGSAPAGRNVGHRDSYIPERFRRHTQEAPAQPSPTETVHHNRSGGGDGTNPGAHGNIDGYANPGHANHVEMGKTDKATGVPVAPVHSTQAERAPAAVAAVAVTEVPVVEVAQAPAAHYNRSGGGDGTNPGAHGNIDGYVNPGHANHVDIGKTDKATGVPVTTK